MSGSKIFSFCKKNRHWVRAHLLLTWLCLQSHYYQIMSYSQVLGEHEFGKRTPFNKVHHLIHIIIQTQCHFSNVEKGSVYPISFTNRYLFVLFAQNSSKVLSAFAIFNFSLSIASIFSQIYPLQLFLFKPWRACMLLVSMVIFDIYLIQWHLTLSLIHFIYLTSRTLLHLEFPQITLNAFSQFPVFVLVSAYW